MTSNKKIWAGYIPPKKDELFSSWYFRLSDMHKIKSHSFSKIYFDNAQIWNRDIDLYCSKLIKEKIINHTPLSINEIENLFLTSYKDLLYNEDKYRIGLIAPLGIFHRKRRLNGLKFCPGCLINDNAYFRKNWRLSSSLVCTHCKIFLLNSCPSCRSPICFYRLETGYKSSLLNYPLNICWNCKNALNIKDGHVKANNLFIEYQKYIDKTLLEGYNTISQYSFQYFYMLNLIQKKIVTKSTQWTRIKNAIEIEYNTILFETSSLDIQKEILQNSLFIPYLLLNKAPEAIALFCKKHNLRYSDFAKDMDNIPFWFEKIFKEYF